MHEFLKFIFGIELYVFRTVRLSIIRSFLLYTQQWYVSYRFVDSLRAGSGRSVLILLAEFYSKNKFEKLVHLVAFIIRIYHDARPPEHQTCQQCCVSANLCAFWFIYFLKLISLFRLRFFFLLQPRHRNQWLINRGLGNTFYAILCAYVRHAQK